MTSTIIGARRLQQFRENLAALDVTLGQEHMDALDEVSKPALDFPADINRDLAPMLAFAGATVDGVPSEVSPMLASSPVRY